MVWFESVSVIRFPSIWSTAPLVSTGNIAQPRGLPRVRALFDGWLEWSQELSGGCVFLAEIVGIIGGHQGEADFVGEINRAFQTLP